MAQDYRFGPGIIINCVGGYIILQNRKFVFCSLQLYWAKVFIETLIQGISDWFHFISMTSSTNIPHSHYISAISYWVYIHFADLNDSFKDILATINSIFSMRILCDNDIRIMMYLVFTLPSPRLTMGSQQSVATSEFTFRVLIWFFQRLHLWSMTVQSPLVYKHLFQSKITWCEK